MNRDSITGRDNRFFFSPVSKEALGCTEPRI